LKTRLALAALVVFASQAAAQETPILLRANQMYVAQVIAEHGPPAEREMCERLMSVYQRVAGKQAAEYKVLFRNTNDVNAFATVTAKGERLVIFTSRLLRGLKSDEAALAMVVGHELGHHVAGHTTRGRDTRTAMAAASMLAGAIIDYQLARRGSGYVGAGREVAGTAGQLVIHKFTRDQEREADRLGLRMMASAGFDPNGAVRLQEKFLKAFGSNSSLMSSHPPTRERLDNVKQQIATDPVLIAAAAKARAPGKDGY
jgi:predicted Zn-dependent protease